MKTQAPSAFAGLFVTAVLFFVTTATGHGASAFQQINEDGFGNPKTTGGLERHIMTVFQGKLYVGASNRNDGVALMVYDGEKWEKAAENGFGSPANIAISSLFATNDKLYAGTNNKGGGEVWEYDGAHWRCLHKGPFGDFLSNQVMGVVEYKGRVYAGLWDQVETKPVEVWAGTELDNWELVSEPGFGDTENEAVLCMTLSSVDGTEKLYAAVWKDFQYKGPDSGCEIWSFDGTTWEKRNPGREGFGELNKGRPGMEPLALYDFNKKLYVGTWAFGTGQPGELWAFDGKNWARAHESLANTMASIYNLTGCNDKLYAVVSSIFGRFELWEGSEDRWKKIIGKDTPVPDKLGHPDNSNIATMECYQDRLILGVPNKEKGFKVFAESTGGGQAKAVAAKKGKTAPELLYFEARDSVYHVPVLFGLGGSNSNSVSVSFEYRKAGEKAWRPASMYSLAGLLQGRPVRNSITRLQTLREQNHYVCVWESEKDIGQTSGTYQLRATARDSKLAGKALVAEKITVNNEAPPKDEMIYVSEGDFYIDKYEYPNHYGYYPLLRTTWEEACEECRKQDKQLCTPEQWEAAYYGEKKLAYPYGPESRVSGRDYCNTYGAMDSSAVPSGLYENCVNDLGLYDMGGNVYEWASRSEEEVFMADQSYVLNSMDSYIMNVEGKDHRHEFLGFRCCKKAEHKKNAVP